MIIGNEVVDLSPLFGLTSTRNFLLSSLNIFDGDGVTSHKVSVPVCWKITPAFITSLRRVSRMSIT
jgi:hypothetical protein